MKKYFSIFIGLIIPYFSVFGGIYYFRFSKEFIWGFPPLYFWIFLWFILTSVCLCIAWEIDKKYYK